MVIRMVLGHGFLLFISCVFWLVFDVCSLPLVFFLGFFSGVFLTFLFIAYLSCFFLPFFFLPLHLCRFFLEMIFSPFLFKNCILLCVIFSSNFSSHSSFPYSVSFCVSSLSFFWVVISFSGLQVVIMPYLYVANIYGLQFYAFHCPIPSHQCSIILT